MAFDKNHTSLGMKIVIIFFAVILVVSLCLPFFSGCVNQSQVAVDDGATNPTASSTDTSTVAGVEAQYATLIASLTDRLSLDPTSMTYLGNLGNAYMACAMAMLSTSDYASNEGRVAGVFEDAVDCYDKYLAEIEKDPKAADQESINTITVDRAVCLYYSGQKDQAVDDLKTFLDGQPDYAMGWYNLGVFYEQEDQAEEAREAYGKAVELDPNGTAGSYANLRMMIMDAVAQQQAEAAGDDAASGDDAQAASDDAAAKTDADDDAATAPDETDGASADDASNADDDAAADAGENGSDDADVADASDEAAKDSATDSDAS